MKGYIAHADEVEEVEVIGPYDGRYNLKHVPQNPVLVTGPGWTRLGVWSGDLVYVDRLAAAAASALLAEREIA